MCAGGSDSLEIHVCCERNPKPKKAGWTGLSLSSIIPYSLALIRDVLIGFGLLVFDHTCEPAQKRVY
jgi:hypothetical protein